MECAYCGEYHQETVKSLAEKSTFVMPTISYANVDQMGIDVLLYNALRKHCLRKVAILSSDSIIPIVGSSPFSDNDEDFLYPTTAIELFYIIDRNVLVLQIRSQPKQGRAHQFSEHLMHFVSSLHPQTLLFLSSGDSTFFDIQFPQKSFVFYSTCPSIKAQIGDKAAEMDIVKEEINGSGLLTLLQKYCDQNSIQFTAFCVFVTEGSNFRDALNYFVQINAIFKWVGDEDIVFPPIWSMLDPWLDEDIL